MEGYGDKASLGWRCREKVEEWRQTNINIDARYDVHYAIAVCANTDKGLSGIAPFPMPSRRRDS